MTCSPQRLKASHESTVPKTARPRSAALAQAVDVAQQPLDLRGREVGVEQEPRARPHQGLVAGLTQLVAALGGAAVLPDERTVQGLPVAGSHTQTVSRWFVMPTAASSPGATPAASSASPATACVTAHISAASCSTHPGRGKCLPNSRYARPASCASTSKTRHVVPVVPWSMASRIGGPAYPARGGRGRGTSAAGAVPSPMAGLRAPARSHSFGRWMGQGPRPSARRVRHSGCSSQEETVRPLPCRPYGEQGTRRAGRLPPTHGRNFRRAASPRGRAGRSACSSAPAELDRDEVA